MTELPDDADLLHERVLVLRAQVGDRAAFQELVDMYQERLTYYVNRLVQDWHEARDILQQVWLDVFRKMGKLQSPNALRVWLYRIAHYRVVPYICRQRVDSNGRVDLATNSVETERWNAGRALLTKRLK